MNSNITNHGMILKRLREGIGIKQTEIAEVLDVSQQFVSKMEKMKIIDEKKLILIAEYLLINVDIFYSFSEEKLLKQVIRRRKILTRERINLSKEKEYSKRINFPCSENLDMTIAVTFKNKGNNQPK